MIPPSPPMPPIKATDYVYVYRTCDVCRVRRKYGQKFQGCFGLFASTYMYVYCTWLLTPRSSIDITVHGPVHKFSSAIYYQIILYTSIFSDVKGGANTEAVYYDVCPCFRDERGACFLLRDKRVRLIICILTFHS